MEEYNDETASLNLESQNERVLKVKRDAETLMQTVHEWKTSDAEKHIDDLLRIKSQIIEQTSSHTEWVDICLSNKDLQKFLIDMTFSCNEDKLKMMTQSLMEHSHSVKEFLNQDQILKWTQIPKEHEEKEKHDIHTLLSDLKENLEMITNDLQRSASNQTRESATHEVTDALNSFCQRMDNMEQYGQNHTALLLQTIMKTVGYREDKFSSILDLEEIKFIHDKLSEVHENYSALKNSSLLQADAYTILTILTIKYKEHNINKRERLDSYFDMKVNMPPEIGDAIKEWQSNKDWDILECKMKSMIEVNRMMNPPANMSEEQTSTAQVVSSIECESEDHRKNVFSKISCEPKELFQKLGLLKKYPCRITVADLFCINNLSLKDTQPESDGELWLHFINKLMMSDVNCRCICPFENVYTVTSEHEDLFNLEAECTETDNDVDSRVHPMDVYLAVFHCADDLAQERILMKLSLCQFALPLLVPNPFTGQIEVPAYALQQIIKTWTSENLSKITNSVRHVDSFILSSQVPVVSFIKLGTSAISKSQIMNNILQHNKHPTFFNRHCIGSTEKCLLLDGVVEIAWYCPGGKKSDVFQDCVSFINLHGDAKNHLVQLEFIKEMSLVIVLLFPENLQDPEIQTTTKTLQKSQVPLIVLYSGVERCPASDFRIAAKNRNEAELTQEIICKVKQALKKKSEPHSLETQIEKTRERALILNKEQEGVRNARETARTLINIIKETESELLGNNENLLTLKKRILPLQGQLWHEWCKNDKELYRIQSTTTMSVEQQKTKISGKKHETRKEQKKAALNLNEFMEHFFKYAFQIEGNTKLAMLNWFGKSLGDLFTDVLAELQDKYNAACTDTRQNEPDKQSMLKDVMEKIKSATFTVQHIIREVAQIYEVLHHFGEKVISHDVEVDKLPELGVDILLSGSALELMDGDVNHIPLEWIKAVFSKLRERIGDKRIFVISVLGLQSSGKSTLLNTMFGLQFPVSAGCCTKGIMMHLIPVEETLQDKLHFDFILVLDTEGLRSTRFNKAVSHDNELATFIVGIGDVTVINIMGESHSEIDDILQICFQAFLRMTSVQVKPCCFFVHQNVSDEAAKEKTQEGRMQLKLKLDEIAKIVGAAEEREVNNFSDVIQLDVETQVYYFKNYFEGNPPMASPNPSYSQSVWELKNKLLSIAEWQKDCKFSSLSELSRQIQNLWNALMRENFVFHFRNSLHVMVFTKLEENYGKWSWKLRKQTLETQNILYYMINSSKSNDTHTNLQKQNIEKTYQEIKTDVESYFKEEKHSEILVQWRDNIDKRLECLKKEVLDELSAKERELLDNKKYRMALDQRRTQYEADLLQKSKDLASELKEQKPSEEELQKRFDQMWAAWENKVECEKPKEERINIQAIIERNLSNVFHKHWSAINVNESHAKLKNSIALTLSKYYFDKALEIGTALPKKVQHGIHKILTQKENQENCYVNENFICQILNEISSIIEECEKSSGIGFKGLYKAQVAAYVCNKIAPQLNALNEKAIQANDPLVYLKSKKTEYYTLFKKYCAGATAVTIFCYYLMTHLNTAVQDAVTCKLSIDIADQIKSSHPAFCSNRANLDKHILKDLAEKENFEIYMEYIFTPQQIFEAFISDSVVECLDNELNLQKMINETWMWLNDQILSASVSATKYTTLQKSKGEKQGNAAVWLDEFCRQLGRHMTISRTSLTNIEKEDIQDTEFLKTSFAESLAKITDAGREKQLNILNSNGSLFNFKNRPKDFLIKQMNGCWAKCPFCAAVCTETIPNHDGDHSTHMHRCQALGGLFYSKCIWNILPFKQLHTDKKFFLNFCTSAVKTTDKFSPSTDKEWIPFKDYRRAGPPYDRWSITPDHSAGLYWKWFICRFREELEQHYGSKFEGSGAIPEEWTKITKREALMELNIPI